MTNITRRNFVKLTGGIAAAASLTGVGANVAFGAGQKVVVIGGGYGGTIAAKYIRRADSSIEVTLIEKEKQYVSCPLSNPVLVGIRDIKVQTWGYDGLKKHGVNVVHDEVVGIDPAAKEVATKGGAKFKYDKLIVSPGVEFADVEGWDQEAMPHAWKAGPQTTLLANKLKAMNDGDPFVIVAPPNPYRCPPGPYERASLVAWYLKKHKPKSKVIILDPKDKFSKQGLFTGGWTKLGLPVEWQKGQVVKRADAKGGAVIFGDMDDALKSSCINIIPAQKAGHIAHVAGLVDEKGWCPVDLKTFESTLHKDVYVIGDSCVAPGLPKSGYAANSEAKVAAAAVVASLKGKEMPDPSYVNTCYSLITPDYGISVALVAHLKDGKIASISDGVSPGDASDEYRKQEAMFAESWYQSVMADMFG